MSNTSCKYYTERTLGWILNNKVIVLLSLLSFCLFVSTLALAGQKNRLSDELDACRTSLLTTTTVTAAPTTVTTVAPATVTTVAPPTTTSEEPATTTTIAPGRAAIEETFAETVTEPEITTETESRLLKLLSGA